MLVLNLAHHNLLSISDQGRGRGILEDISRGEVESRSIVKTAKKRGPQMRSVGFLFCLRVVSAGCLKLMDDVGDNSPDHRLVKVTDLHIGIIWIISGQRHLAVNY